MSKKKEHQTMNLLCLFHVVAAVEKGSDVGEFLNNETEWMGEPTSSTGTVIIMRLKEWSLSKNGPPNIQGYLEKKDGITEGEDKPSRQNEKEVSLNFSFRGVKFCVDSGKAEVRASGKPFESELEGNNGHGWWPLVVEKVD